MVENSDIFPVDHKCGNSYSAVSHHFDTFGRISAQGRRSFLDSNGYYATFEWFFPNLRPVGLSIEDVDQLFRQETAS